MVVASLCVELSRGKLGSSLPLEPTSLLELLIVDGAFHAPFLGFRRTGAREMRSQVSVVDALGHDHGQHNVDGTLMRVNTQRGHAGFEMGGEFGSL